MTVTVAGAAPKFGALFESPRMLVDGQWVESVSGAVSDVVDPGTGEVITQVAAGDETDVDAAVRAALRAFEEQRWSGLSGQQRAGVLWRAADLIEANADELAALESLDVGMPVPLARGFIGEAVNQFRYFAGWADKIHGRSLEIGPADRRFHAYTSKEPIGVAGMIVPWNAPAYAASMKLAPALAAGCSCVLKPSEETPLTALAIGSLLLEAGVPEGVVNVVTGFGPTVGAPLVAHDCVHKVSFTGSTQVGKEVVRAATGNLKKLSLELGGKSAMVVLPDVEVSQVVAELAGAIFMNTGQICTAGSRLYVHREVFDEVVEGVAEVARSLKIGYGADPSVDLGPLVSARHLDRVGEYVRGGIADGARVVCGGSRIGDRGYFFEPTVLADVDQSMRVVREEIFGPVLCAQPFTDVDEAVAKANDTEFGLAASVWTRDVASAHSIARRLRAGRVGINVHRAGGVQMPVGGYDQSGWGRECGPEAVEEYLETKSVLTLLDR
ncbi:aldehyde dehydrogenase family protein [Saccharopolyspora indica]|uniref:aldehyde dehydrogenase family protein n=1 Tax=Saccharopolyspora indica TaxID=1229659 RepID=UPI0022EB5D4B|nr:aldehyde dehydrogenase family protein [Saccharopolyspora indica]MDA3644244.1 aldehyde dehydrogenase family protein [Saccharopolyspora indica]